MTHPEPFPVLNSDVYFLKSEINQIEYQISVTKPFPYHDDQEKSYPCLVVLDSQLHQVLAAGILQHLFFSDFPEIILAGIGPKSFPKIQNFSDWLLEAFRDRWRDYSPTIDQKMVENNKAYFGEALEQGKADEFYRILYSEFLPFIKENYRIQENDISIMGHSLGGMFVLYSLFSDPKIFRGYAASSPSLHFDEEIMFSIEEEYSTKHQVMSFDLYLAVGEDEEDSEYKMVSNLKLFSDVMVRNYQGLNLKMDIFKNADHMEVIPLATLAGLKFLYKDQDVD